MSIAIPTGFVYDIAMTRKECGKYEKMYMP